jgi:hypothetical protein
MRKVLAVAVVALAAVLAGGDGVACGDKFVVIGRGVRAQRAKGAVQKAAILMYLDAGSELRAAMKEQGLEKNLKLAGHRVRTVANRRELVEALESDRHDIVLAGIADMATLKPALGTVLGPRPMALPILYNPTDDEMAEAERLYSCVLKSPAKQQHYLAVIDEAMAQQRAVAKARRDKVAGPEGRQR